MRRTENKQKLYRVQRSGLTMITRALVFFTCVIIFASILSKGEQTGGISVTPSITPAPTPVVAAFDETPDSRELTVSKSLWYAIQLGAFENEEAAKSLAQTYQGRGAAGYVMFHQNRYRTMASLYPSKEDAQAVRETLKNSHSIESYVCEIEVPELTLKLTGMKGQIDVIEAAFRFMSECIFEMQKMSIALDQKEANTTDVANQLRDLSTRAYEILNLLQKRFTSPKHQMVEQLEQLVGQTAQLKDAISADTLDSVSLAAILKYDTLLLLDQTVLAYEQMMQ